MEDPSKPNPSVNTSSSSMWAGAEKCCIIPGRSQNLTSTISIDSLSSRRTTSAGVRGFIVPPVRHGSLGDTVDPATCV